MGYGQTRRSQRKRLTESMAAPYSRRMSDQATPDNLAEIAAQAIGAAGGGALLARSLGVKRASVQQWKASGIPAARVPAVSRITGIPMHQLRPDLFDAPAFCAAQQDAPA